MTRSSWCPSFRSGGADSGATAIEYGIVAALLALGIFGGAVIAGNGLGAVFDTVSTTLFEAIARIAD